MGKKRGKDKSSREEEDTDVIGRVYDMSIIHQGMWKCLDFLGDFYHVCSYSQDHHADTLKREQTKLFSRNSLGILIGQVVKIARMKKSKNHQPHGCA